MFSWNLAGGLNPTTSLWRNTRGWEPAWRVGYLLSVCWVLSEPAWCLSRWYILRHKGLEISMVPKHSWSHFCQHGVARCFSFSVQVSKSSQDGSNGPMRRGIVRVDILGAPDFKIGAESFIRFSRRAVAKATSGSRSPMRLK